MLTPYDLAGNIYDDGTYKYKYDAENRVCAVYRYQSGSSMTQYFYDTMGNRIAKANIGVFSCDVTTNGFTASGPSSNYVVGSSGEQLDEYDATGATPVHSNVFAGSRLLATYNGSSWLYAFNDWLGTKRAQISADGNLGSLSTFASLPFGDKLAVSGADATENHFTGKERDTESGLDNFGARYYGSNMGRFISPDPKQPSMKHLMNPQKWNKYAYVLNNPLSLVDPDGMEEMTIVYRTFIAQPTITFLGRTYQGDGRTFSTASTVSSRSSITVRIETDPSIRPGNPIISQTSSAGQSRTIDSNGNTIKSGQAQTGLPVATGSRDANGNAVIGITQDPKDPVSPVPQFMTPGVSANLSMNFTQDGSSVTTTGTASIFPSQELNVSGADGTTTPVFRFTPDPSSSPFAMYVKDRKVNCTTTGTGSTCQ